MKIRAIKPKQPELSKAEREFLRDYKEGFNGTKFDGCKVLGGHEQITFNMMGMKYTPDFIGTTSNGELIIIEIKSNNKQRDYYYSRSRLVASSLVLPLFHYIIVEVGRKGPGGWKIRRF